MLNISFFFPETLQIKGAKIEQSIVTLELISSQKNSCCPVCQRFSCRIHSHYKRTIMDLPILGYTVCLKLCCRKFFCDTLECTRSIFTERFSAFIHTYSRQTERLKNIHTVLAFSTNSRTSSKLSCKMGIPLSHDSFVKIIRETALPVSNTQKIAVDDWAYRKGNNYGTLVCDLETNKPIDLFKERNSQALENWLKEHQDIQVATRDRATSYSNALKAVCPEAAQVADRFHLVKNLLDVLKEISKKKLENNILIGYEEIQKSSQADEKENQPKTKAEQKQEERRERKNVTIQRN